MPLPPRLRNERKPLPFFCVAEMQGPLSKLTPEARCLINDLRLFSWVNGGIENTEEAIQAIARPLGFDEPTVWRLMPEIRKFFIPDEEEGRLCYEPDEAYRLCRLNFLLEPGAEL